MSRTHSEDGDFSCFVQLVDAVLFCSHVWALSPLVLKVLLTMAFGLLYDTGCADCSNFPPLWNVEFIWLACNGGTQLTNE